MKAPFTLGPAIEKAINIVAIIGVMGWVLYPYIHAQASNSLQNSGDQALVFEVKNLSTPDANTDSTIQNSAKEDQTHSVTYDELAKSDPLVQHLQSYLESYDSPLAEYADQIVLQPQWQRALAISWGESNYAIHCYANNCSGIGGAPWMKSWRSYPDKLAWFKDMSALMETSRYKERFTSCRTMNGVYNAGSQSWVRACEQKSAELMALTQEAEQERVAMINTGGPTIISAATAELSLK